MAASSVRSVCRNCFVQFGKMLLRQSAWLKLVASVFYLKINNKKKKNGKMFIKTGDWTFLLNFWHFSFRAHNLLISRKQLNTSDNKLLAQFFYLLSVLLWPKVAHYVVVLHFHKESIKISIRWWKRQRKTWRDIRGRDQQWMTHCTPQGCYH